MIISTSCQRFSTGTGAWTGAGDRGEGKAPGAEARSRSCEVVKRSAENLREDVEASWWWREKRIR